MMSRMRCRLWRKASALCFDDSARAAFILMLRRVFDEDADGVILRAAPPTRHAHAMTSLAAHGYFQPSPRRLSRHAAATYAMISPPIITPL